MNAIRIGRAATNAKQKCVRYYTKEKILTISALRHRTVDYADIGNTVFD
jgi:hypothetical protein